MFYFIVVINICIVGGINVFVLFYYVVNLLLFIFVKFVVEILIKFMILLEFFLKIGFGICFLMIIGCILYSSVLIGIFIVVVVMLLILIFMLLLLFWYL